MKEVDKQCGKADASFFPHRQRGEAERVSPHGLRMEATVRVLVLP